MTFAVDWGSNSKNQRRELDKSNTKQEVIFMSSSNDEVIMWHRSKGRSYDLVLSTGNGISTDFISGMIVIRDIEWRLPGRLHSGEIIIIRQITRTNPIHRSRQLVFIFYFLAQSTTRNYIRVEWAFQTWNTVERTVKTEIDAKKQNKEEWASSDGLWQKT